MAQAKRIESNHHVAQAIVSAAESKAEQQAQAQAATNAVVNQAVTAARADERKQIESRSIIIDRQQPAGESFILATNKDGKTVGTSPDKTVSKGMIVRELPFLSMEQASTILHQHDQASFTLASASASFIVGYLQSLRGVSAAATDTKAWKTVKTGCEIEAGVLSFPQQWENYFTAVKKFLAFGGDIQSLTYQNESNAVCVRTLYWIKQENARLDNTPPLSKAERIANSLDNAATTALGGRDGEGETIAAGDIEVDTATAKLLLDIAECNLGTTRCRELLMTENVEQTLRRLIASEGAHIIKAMVDDLVA